MALNGRKISRLVALVSLAVLVALAGCSSGSGGNSAGGGAGEKAPYRIGAVLSLTGTYSGLGTPEKNTIDMEVARINGAGGVNGHKLEVVIEDDATDAAKAAAAASKLIDQEKVVAILGATGTGQTMAMRQAVDRAKVPQVSMAGGNAVTGKFDKFVFQTPWSNKLVVPFVLKYMQGKGVKSVALLTDTGGYGKDGLAVIEEDLGKFGMTAAAKETFNPGDTDMTAQLTKIAAANPQAVLLWNAGKEAAIVMKNREQLKMSTPFFGGSGQGRKEFVDGAGAAADAFEFGTGKDLMPESWGTDSEEYKVTKDFVDRYTAKYGKAPDIFAGHAYDALNITVEAMKKLPEGFTPEQLRDQIEKTSGFIGMGGSFNYSATDHMGLTENDLQMYRVEGGKWVLAK
jgi:branched-chain amino acid transport system substrate-binding protein